MLEAVAVSICLLLCAAPVQAQITDLASFDGTNGSYPVTGLTLIGSNLYGTTSQDGPGGAGGVFSVPVGGGLPTVIGGFSFGTQANGAQPFGGVTLSSDGTTLYGTTLQGGVGFGVVFSVPLAGGTPTALATFNETNGTDPIAGLTRVGSNLYGTTFEGGPNGGGVVFSVPVSGGPPAVLTSFNGPNGVTGAAPYGSVILSADGNTFYGTTKSGGANGDGVVFSLPIGGGSPTVLTSFNGSNGQNPTAGLTLSADGTTLYGTTNSGGANGDGAVFSLPVGGGTPTVLASFNGANGQDPTAGLTLSADGTTLYGTTYSGGANGDGEVFSLSVGGGIPTILASFDGADGQNPAGGLTLSADGTALYGATGAGGVSDVGVVFSVPTGVPEPGGATLLVTGLVLAVARRSRKRPRSERD